MAEKDSKPGRHCDHTKGARRFYSGSRYDEETDVLIVGSGGAALCAALRSHAHSFRAIVIEKDKTIGGTTAWSGGGLWIPNNLYIQALGRKDSVEEARKYLDRIIGDIGPASSPARRLAFLENAPRMLEFLVEVGFQGRASGNYPDYYPNLPGGSTEGRSVEGALFNLNRLPATYPLNSRKGGDLPIHSDEGGKLFCSMTSMSNFLFTVKAFGMRKFARRLLGHRMVGMGPSLVGQLLLLNLQRETLCGHTRHSPSSLSMAEPSKGPSSSAKEEWFEFGRIEESCLRRGGLLGMLT